MLDTIFNFIQNLIRKNNDTDSENIFKAVKNIVSDPSSIFSKAKSNIFKFPCIVSSSIIEPSTAAIMLKSAEIEYSNLILLLSGINPFLNDNDNVTIRRRLSDIHSNDNNIFYEDTVFNPTLNDVISDIFDPPMYSTEAQQVPPIQQTPVNTQTQTTQQTPVNTQTQTTQQTLVNTQTQTTQQTLVNTQTQTTQQTLVNTQTQTRKILNSVNHDILDRITDKIYSSYSKMFNMTLISLNFSIHSDGKISKETIPLGVKCVPHVVPSDSVVYLFESALTSNRGLLRFFQATSGEIRFISDFLLQLDILKKQEWFAKNVSSYRGWVELLKNRQASRKIYQLFKLSNAMFGVNDKKELKELTPICTVFMTMADVDGIEDNTGINIFMNTSLLRKVMNDLMLLGIFILDESTNVVHILFNGESKFESHSLRSLGDLPKTKGDISDVLLNVMKRT